MYQFSEQLDNAVAPVDSIFASVTFGDPHACAIPEAIHRWGMEIFPAFQKSDTIMIRPELLPRLEAFRSCNVRKVDKRPLQKFRISRTLPGQIRRARVCKHNLRIHSATETFLLDYFTRSQLAFLLRHNGR